MRLAINHGWGTRVRLLMMLSLLSTPVFPQQQNFLLSVSHSAARGSAWQVADGSSGEIDSENSGDFSLEASYGHALDSRGTELYYGVGFRRLRWRTEPDAAGTNGRFDSDGKASRVTEESEQTGVVDSRMIPERSRASVYLGLSNQTSENSRWHNQIQYGFSQGNDEQLHDRNTRVSGMSYVEIRQGSTWRYGFGVQLERDHDDMLVLPIAGLEWQSGAYGVELLLPGRVRLWRELGSRSYVDLYAEFNEHEFELVENAGAGPTHVHLSEFTAGVAVRYLWQDMLSLSFGVQLPIRQYRIEANNESIELTQDDSIGVALGVKFVTTDATP